jgi:hypothetical protein
MNATTTNPYLLLYLISILVLLLILWIIEKYNQWLSEEINGILEGVEFMRAQQAEIRRKPHHEDLIVWADGTNCLRYELSEMNYMSDDYRTIAFESKEWWMREGNQNTL